MHLKTRLTRTRKVVVFEQHIGTGEAEDMQQRLIQRNVLLTHIMVSDSYSAFALFGFRVDFALIGRISYTILSVLIVLVQSKLILF